MKIGSNISSINAQRRLGDATDALTDTYARLSSGLRINKASDDAAGLAIASDLKNRSRIFTQGIRNGSDGISVLNIADAALGGLSSVVIRIRELATQAANGSYSRNQRSVIDAEAQALRAEFLRIASSTSFNGTNLFDGSLGDGLRLQLGIGLNGSILSGVGGAIGTGGVNVGSTSLDANNIGLAETIFADLNGDGVLDKVTSATQASSVGHISVSLGNGDGSFRAATSYVGNEVRDFKLGDVNGDGLLDLVSVEGEPGSGGDVGVRLGQSGGAFGSISYLNVPQGGLGSSRTINKIELGDLDGNGTLDIVGAGEFDPSFIGGNEIGVAYVFSGSGNGAFSAAVSRLTGVLAPTDLKVADLNGDGNLDLIVANSDSIGTGFGTGTGSFGTFSSFSSGNTSTFKIRLGDINGDGRLDILAGGSDTVGQISVRLGSGNGSFSSSTTIYEMADGTTRDFMLTDVNGDGFLDLVSTGANADFSEGVLTIRRGVGDGTFGAAQSRVIIDSSLQSGGAVAALVSIAAGDLNGDGVLDFLVGGTADNASSEYSATGTILLSQTQQGIGPLINFSLKTAADALQAFGPLDNALRNLAKQRGEIGAHQSRISIALNALSSTRDNYLSATGRIQDADIAAESAALTRLQILQQAGAAVLSQANQQPDLVLRLL